MIEREFSLDSGGIQLRGAVVLPYDDGDWPLAVLCHGIPSGAPAQGDPGYEALAHRFARQGSAACYFNFRGTGLSGGDFSLAGWVSDLEVVLEEARAPWRYQGISVEADALPVLILLGLKLVAELIVGGVLAVVVSRHRYRTRQG